MTGIDLRAASQQDPRFRHDCDECIFLGRSGRADLYYCYHGPTVIARRSSEGSDYSSGMCFVGRSPELTEAFLRAGRRGLLTRRDWELTRPDGEVLLEELEPADFSPLNVVTHVSGPMEGMTVRDHLTDVANALAAEVVQLVRDDDPERYAELVNLMFEQLSRACNP